MTDVIANAVNSAELLAALGAIDISVPGRTAGRTTRHTEMWSMCRLLSTLAQTNRLAYPVTVRHTDKPDFIVKAGQLEIGVEITEATNENYSSFLALAERERPGAILELGHFHPRNTKLDSSRMRELLDQDHLSSEGWGGYSAEYEWVEYVVGAVERKLAKLPHYEACDSRLNWLLIYSNTPLPSIFLEEALSILVPRLAGCWQQSPTFDALYIEKGKSIIVITVDGCTVMPLHDLWRSKSTSEEPDEPGNDESDKGQDTISARKGSLADFLLNSPLRNSGIVIEREHSEMREIDFGFDDDDEPSKDA